MESDQELARYFAALSAAGGTPPLSQDEVGAVLDLARVVAHTAERRFAPVSTYLAGLMVGAAGATGDPADRAARLRALAKVAADLGREEGGETA